ncbi:hypothetical protein CI102_5240 [Trichoderma harzianum]|nr:hypothetical protein CI102_5240 [Trichoderma harzianum]
MPSATRTGADMAKPIPLRAKLARRFYEPILLEVALKKIRPQQSFSATQHEPNTMRDNVDSAEQTFKCFVNRLAQVCDNKRGENGSTVTGIAVLEEPEGVHYIIGSNNRKASKLPEVKLFVEQLLEIVAKSTEQPASNGSQVHREALWHILKFDGNRVRFYLTSTIVYLEECISDYDRRHGQNSLSSEAARFKSQLSKLTELVKFGNDKQLEDPQYFAACEKLFLFLHEAQRRKFGDSISEQAREGEMDNSKPWLELRHFVGRLHSYYLAVETIIRASRLWDRLFHEIKVTVIPSATMIPHPLNKKRPNASEIIGRMSSSAEIIERHRSMAEQLQVLDLDVKILEGCNSASLTHMVHAEVLVLDYVLNYLRDNADVEFWHKWRYVGSSKPTCRLCNYYFEKHPEGVQARESHNNLYPHWRAPDVFDKKAMDATEGLLIEINKKIRVTAARLLEDQVLQGRKHDSNSFSKQPWRTDQKTDPSDLTSRMGGLSIGSVSIPNTIEEEDKRSPAGEPDDEEEEGGIIVFRGRKTRPSRS